MCFLNKKKLQKITIFFSVIACTVALAAGTLTANAEAEPAITGFVTDTLDLIDGGTNLIDGGDFESTPTGSWNVDGLLTNGASIDSDNPFKGSKQLKFVAGESETIASFTVPVTAEKSYMFSVWVKGSQLSDDNSGDVHFGIADPATGDFLTTNESNNVNSTGTKALTPPSWDGEWYQRGYIFNSGNLTSIGIVIRGTASTAYFDNMVLCLEEDSVKPDTTITITHPEVTNANPDKKGCKPQHNLFENTDFSGSDTAFWSEVDNFDAFLSIGGDKGKSSNKVLLYDGGSEVIGTGATYKKWLDVKPNTEYTFTTDVKAYVESGMTFGLMYLDGNGMPHVIAGDISVPSNQTGKWMIASYSFNTKDIERVAFFINDGGGNAAFDFIKLFESVHGTKLTDTNADPNQKPIDPGKPDDGKKPGVPSTKTGDASAIVFVVIAFLSAAVIGVLSYKKYITRRKERQTV